MSRIRITLLLCCTALLAGCMPDSPRTAFDWGVNDRLPRPAAAKKSASTYVYRDKDAQASANTVGRNVPVSATVTSQALPPIAGNAPVFDWPVSGRVISDFGTTANGGKNDGINLAASKNTPIHASASGTVTYASDGLKNYGNLVLVKHSGGYTTAYAHADRLIVAQGATVTRGQVIGYVGQTGDVSSPQLHFEIRSGTTPVNPRSYLSSATASN